MSAPEHDTIEKILHTAEASFAVHGFFASSLRQITRDAGVNVAAVHYHFGSKEALFVEVLSRRLTPFMHSLFAHLDAAQAQGKNLSAEDVVDSFVQACFELIQSQDTQAALFSKLMSRLMLDEYRPFREQLAAQNTDFGVRLQAVFQAVLPDLPPEVVRWRMHLSWSTLFNAFAGNDVLKVLAPAKTEVNARDPEQVARFVKPFVVAGLQAPLSEK